MGVATFETREIREHRWRYLVRTAEGFTYGLCSCPEGHRTAELAEDCPKAQEAKKKYVK